MRRTWRGKEENKLGTDKGLGVISSSGAVGNFVGQDFPYRQAQSMAGMRHVTHREAMTRRALRARPDLHAVSGVHAGLLVHLLVRHVLPEEGEVVVVGPGEEEGCAD